MPTVGRRAFLISGLAAATAACSRAHPTATTQPVTDFIVSGYGRAVSASLDGLSPVQRLATITTAAETWWRPVVQAFNRAHPHLRAKFGSMGVNPKATDTGGIEFQPNPTLSCEAGVPRAGADLSAAMRDANLDATALLPGLLAAASDRDGAVWGMPMDYGVLVNTYNAAALSTAHVTAPPAAGWTADQFTAAVNALAHSGSTTPAFGLGLGDVGSSTVPAWFGFAEGYGGNVFGTRVTLSSGPVYEGLRRYADILRITWTGQYTSENGGQGVLGFWGVKPTLDPKPPFSSARFPRLPVAVVPADVLVAAVPTKAPQPAAGATFAVWLATVEGQKALTALGYPPVRLDEPGATSAGWADTAGMRPSDFRFRPGGIFGPVGTPAMSYDFDHRIALALLQPEPVRLTRLKSLEQALTGVLNNSMTRKQAAAMLDKEGVTAQ